MKIDIRFIGLESSGFIRVHALRRIQFRLSRFGHDLISVVLRLSDINGPKGGIDKRCRITVQGPRIGILTLDELSGDAYSAVDMVIERTADTIVRELERVRSIQSRQAHQPHAQEA
jgi:putative sigma-54 modulation protein